MAERITVLIEYEHHSMVPRFGANMTALGGKIIAVQFDDALAENEWLQENLDRRGVRIISQDFPKEGGK